MLRRLLVWMKVIEPDEIIGTLEDGDAYIFNRRTGKLTIQFDRIEAKGIVSVEPDPYGMSVLVHGYGNNCEQAVAAVDLWYSADRIKPAEPSLIVFRKDQDSPIIISLREVQDSWHQELPRESSSSPL